MSELITDRQIEMARRVLDSLLSRFEGNSRIGTAKVACAGGCNGRPLIEVEVERFDPKAAPKVWVWGVAAPSIQAHLRQRMSAWSVETDTATAIPIDHMRGKGRLFKV